MRSADTEEISNAISGEELASQVFEHGTLGAPSGDRSTNRLWKLCRLGIIQRDFRCSFRASVRDFGCSAHGTLGAVPYSLFL